MSPIIIWYIKLAYETLVDPTIRYLLDCWRRNATPRTTDLLNKIAHGLYIGFFHLLDSEGNVMMPTPEWKQISPNSLSNIEIGLKKIPSIYNIYKLNLVKRDSLFLIRFLNLQENGLNTVYFITINRAGIAFMVFFSGIGVICTIIIVVKLSRHLYNRKIKGKPEEDK